MSVARQVLTRLGCRMPAVTVTRGVASAKGDQVTHTGQQFDKSDPRNARFTVTGLEKQVNQQFAIDLIAKVPPIVVNKRIVSIKYLALSVFSIILIYHFRLPVMVVVVLLDILKFTLI